MIPYNKFYTVTGLFFVLFCFVFLKDDVLISIKLDFVTNYSISYYITLKNKIFLESQSRSTTFVHTYI